MIDAKGYIKLIDMGTATFLEDYHDRTYTVIGTPHYMAPEIIKKLAYGAAVDIWSIGILMYKLLKLGKHPYLNETLSR